MQKKLQPINPIPFTKENEEFLKDKLSKYCVNRKLFGITTQTICKPFRALYLNMEGTNLLLINPYIKKYGEDKVESSESSEFDCEGRKQRKVLRSTNIQVECDNLGTVLFSGDTKENTNGLNETILVQQYIDLLDGITIADKNINKPIITKKYDRNQLVLAKSQSGNVEFIKYKYIQKYMKEGYLIM